MDRFDRPAFLTALAAVVAGATMGCAPLASFRPPTGMMDDRSIELGAGGAVLSPRPYAQDSWRGAGQVWVSGPVADWLELSGVMAFDDEAALGGGAAQARYVRTDRFAGSVELELGWAWGAVALPVAVRLFDETWIYASPRLGTLGDELTPGVPLGVSVHVWDGLMIRAEGQVSWAAFRYYNRRVHLGLAVAYQL